LQRRRSETISGTSTAAPTPADERKWVMRKQFKGTINDLERGAAAMLARE
jgi:hypothetical protein